MATYQLKTFLDIVTAIQEELKIQSSDVTSLNRIRRDLNIVYQNEVIPFAQWKWLRGYVNITLPAKLTAGTASVTQNSRIVTLSSAPAISQKGNNFSVIGFNEIYRVAQHSVGSSTLTLDASYNGSTSATQSYQLWSDRLTLPSELRETFEVGQDFNPAPLQGVGLQQFRKYVNPLPFAEGYPQYYTTGNYVDPTPYVNYSSLPAVLTRASATLVKTLTFASSLSAVVSVGDRIEVAGCSIDSYNGQFVVSTVSGSTLTYTGLMGYEESTVVESSLTVQVQDNMTDPEHFKQLFVYPSIVNTSVTLHIDYIKEAPVLIDDSDEPLMPISDRVVLLYGALQRAWSRERNPEEASRNQGLYQAKLSRMAGKLDDSTDTPVLRPSRPYLRVKRSSQRFSDRNSGWADGSFGGSSGAQQISGVANNIAYYNGSGQLASEPQVTIAQGGTGQTTAAASFDALAPTTAQGDLIARGSSTNQALHIGSNNTVLQSNGSSPSWAQISNAQIISSAGIAYSKLTLNNSIVNSDINSAAAIVYSKLNLAFSILNSDINSAAAIAYSKLNLAASIKDSDIISTAAIARTKLATGTASQIVANDASGNLTSLSSIAISQGGTSATTKAGAFNALAPTATTGDTIYFTSAGSNVALAIGSANSVLTSNGSIPVWSTIANANIVSTAAISYSKLNLAASILNSDIASTAAIAYSKLNLASSITNSDIISTAAIARSKLATDTTNTFVTNNSSGVIQATAVTAGRVVVTDTNGLPSASTVTALNIANLGQKQESIVSAATNTAATLTWFDATSVTLSAGTWMLTGVLNWTIGTGVLTGLQAIGISTTTGNASTGLIAGSNRLDSPTTPTATSDYAQILSGYIVTPGSDTQYFLKAITKFSAGQPQYMCRLTALRIS